jgi:hypothetical protein
MVVSAGLQGTKPPLPQPVLLGARIALRSVYGCSQPTMIMPGTSGRRRGGGVRMNMYVHTQIGLVLFLCPAVSCFLTADMGFASICHRQAVSV